jgi:hypothetical protein
VTAAGRVVADRRSMRCGGCGLTAYPADDRIGLDGFLSAGAVRLACLAAASWSFDVASDRLDELAGVRIDDETIRRSVHRAAAGLAARREAAPPEGFADARGEREFLTDGVMAPTRDGWRELKLARFQVRPPGAPAEVADWAGRALPPPTASVTYATTADSEAFSARWVGWSTALGIDPAAALTVLADGAAWIWSAATEHFPAADQVLDIFHAGQHIAAAAAALHGEGTPEAADWLGRGRARLLADGWPGLLDHVGGTPAEGRTPSGQAAIDEMIGYFAKHTGRVGYFGRLRAGRSIGSGAIEGVARRMGRRLKVPGRGWRIEHIDGMASLIATVDTPEWSGLWARPAAYWELEK